jgi:hypothetical protein
VHGELQVFDAGLYVSMLPAQTQVVLSLVRFDPLGQVVHEVLLPSPYEFAGHATHPLMSAAGTQYVPLGQHTIRLPVVHWADP